MQRWQPLDTVQRSQLVEHNLSRQELQENCHKLHKYTESQDRIATREIHTQNVMLYYKVSMLSRIDSTARAVNMIHVPILKFNEVQHN